MMNEDVTEAVPAVVGQAEIVCPQILSFGKMGAHFHYVAEDENKCYKRVI